MTVIRPLLQIVLPLAVLGGGYLLAKHIAAQAPRPQAESRPDPRPSVRLATAQRTTLRLTVQSQGNVEPFRTVDLSAEVGGRIVATGPSLRPGGTFAAGDVLLRLDGADFEVAIVQQAATVARAELRVLQERAEADAAVRAWKELEGDRAADPLVVRGPQIREAEAELAAARAVLQKRRLDLQRTEVKAPFAGRVQTLVADLGQTVQPGQRLATLFDTSAVEVRLPLPLDEAAFVDLPLRAEAPAGQGAPTELIAEYGGESHSWSGRIVRIAGEVDRRTRQMTAVARVDDDDGSSPRRPPLLVGMFVQARIAGREVDAVVIPRRALHGDGTVWVATTAATDGQAPRTVLTRRAVQVLRAEPERVLLRDGLAAGEAVCVTALDAPTDGMPVRVVDDRGAEIGR